MKYVFPVMMRINAPLSCLLILLTASGCSMNADWFTKNVAETAPDHADPEMRSRSIEGVDLKELDAIVEKVVAAQEDMVVVEAEGIVLKAERKSGLFRFVDDVELTLTPHEGKILLDGRSASRVGIGDFGANRRTLLRLFDAIEAEVRKSAP